VSQFTQPGENSRGKYGAQINPILCLLLAMPNSPPWFAISSSGVEQDYEMDRAWIIGCGKFLMRFLVLLIVAVGVVDVAAPSQAQTYDPNYPICLQIYDDMVHYYFECSYTSMAQCQASASGRAAQCVVNPYFAKPSAKPNPRRRRPHKR
jgi:hypothetical protein